MNRILRFLMPLGMLCLILPAARADSYNVVDQYNVTGALTIVGNNACPPLPACAETIVFSFQIGVVQLTDAIDNQLLIGGATGYFPYLIPGSGSLQSFGPLEQF